MPTFISIVTPLLRKLLRLILIVLVVSILTFVLVSSLPGDVTLVTAGFDASPEDVEAHRQAIGLDRPLHVRYVNWLTRAVQGNLGRSHITDEPVSEALKARLAVTVELLVVAQIMALLMALPIGVWSAYRAGSALDRGFSITAFGLLSIPSFIMALLLIFIFALRLQWLPASGFMPLAAGLWANLRSLLLPGLSLALVEWVPLMRLLRSDMVTTLKEDFIKTARAKGVSTRGVLFKHALRPSSLSLLTVLGLQVGHLISGSVVVETIFAMPGLGRLLVEALFARDFPVVQGCVLVITVGYVSINFLVDLAYTLLDPRISRRRRHA